MKYKERPCNAIDCDRWVDEPEICIECIETVLTIELDINLEEDD